MTWRLSISYLEQMRVRIKQKTLEALRLLRQADHALNEVCKYFNNLTKDV